MTVVGVRATAASVANGTRSAREVVEEALIAADECAEFGALWHVDEEGARAAADTVDRQIARGEFAGPMSGVPVVVKDAFHVRGMPGGGGGPIAIAQRDATVVRRLRKAGAILLGKAAMHQLGWGMTGQTPGRPLCRNPRDPDRQPGGSSSGSAAVVAAGIVPLALGGDTGGSVRQPAAWCDVVGWKPAQASIPRDGLDPLSPALDTIGWFTRSVDDAAFVHEILTGQSLSTDQLGTELTFGVDDDVLERAQSPVADAVRRALAQLEKLGFKRVSVPMPGLPARLGVVYAADLAAHWAHVADSNPEIFGDDVIAGIETGRAIKAVDYLRCLADRDLERGRTWGAATVACGPTCPVRPPLLTEPDDVRHVGSLTRPYNLLDWPAISVPMVDTPGVGIQIAAPPARAAQVMRVALALEATLKGIS